MKKLLLLVMISVVCVPDGIAQSEYMGSDSLLMIQEGMASYYGKRFHKKKTASGEVFDMRAHTAAHKHLPFGTLLRVRNLDNGYEVIVRVNDRLPQNSRRIIDLSRTAAEQLDMIHDGLTTVKLYALSFEEIKQLREYYEQIPDGLRLRVHYEPIQWQRKVDILSALVIQHKIRINKVSAL